MTTHATQDATTQPRKLRLLARLLLSLLLALLLAEAGARLLIPEPVYAEGFVLDAQLGFRSTPHMKLPCGDARGEFEFRTNGLGARGRELPAEDADDSSAQRRILFLGDSFLHAWGVRDEDIVSQVTESLLREAGQDVATYNLSCPAFGTAQELLLLRRHAAAARPDAVVLLFFTGNDVLNNSLSLAGRSYERALDYLRPYLVPSGSGGFEVEYLHRVRSLLRPRSRLFAKLEADVYLRSRLHSLDNPGFWPQQMQTWDERARTGVLPMPALGVFADPKPSSPWFEAWDTTEALLRTLAEEVRGMGARLLVVVIPDRIEVVHTAKRIHFDLDLYGAGHPVLDQLLDWNYSARRLGSLFAEERIEARLLVEPFRRALAEEVGDSLYIADGHLATRGHHLAGEEVARWFLAASELSAGEPVPAEPVWTGEDLSAPLDLLSVAADPLSWLDFSQAPHQHLLDHGWAEWRHSWFGGPGGWGLREYAWTALPARNAAIVLRGSLPEIATFPAVIRFGIPRTNHYVEHVAEGPGPFELTLDHGMPIEGVVSSVPVRITSDARVAVTDGQFDLGLFVHALGYPPR